MNRHFSQTILSASLFSVLGAISFAQGPVQPAKQPPAAPKSDAAPTVPTGPLLMLEFIGGIDDEGRLVTFQMIPATQEEQITRDVTVRGKKMTIAIKRQTTVYDRVPSPVPFQDVKVTNLKGDDLSEDEVRKAISKDTLVLQLVDSPDPLTPLQIERIKPDTLLVVIKPRQGPMPAEPVPVPVQPATDAATPAAGPAPVDRTRFPISPAPWLMYVSDLNAKGEFTVFEAVPETVLRTVKETVKDEQGQTKVVEKQVEATRMASYPRKTKLGKSPILLLKEAAVKEGKHGEEISVEEAQRRIGKGAFVLIPERGLPDPRYLTVFRDDTLILNQAAHGGHGYGGEFEQPPFPIDETLTQLKDADPAVRREAASNLQNIIYDRKSVELISKAAPALAAAMKDEDPGVRFASVAAVRHFGPWAKAAAPALAEAAKDETIAFVAHEALRHIGPEATSAVPKLVELLQGESDADRIMAADTLLSIAPGKSKAAVPKLIEFLKTEESELRNRAATVLAKVAPDQARAAVPILLEQLKAENADVGISEGRVQAIRALSLVAPHVGKELVPSLIELIEALSEPEERLEQVQIATILVQLDPEQAAVAVPVLASGLFADFAVTTGIAASALLPLTPEFAEECRDALLADLQSANPGVPVQYMLPPDRGLLGTIHLLRGTPEQTAEAQRAIVTALQRISASERFRTLTEWGQSPFASKELVPVVNEFFNDPDETIQAAAKTTAAALTKLTSTAVANTQIPSTASRPTTPIGVGQKSPAPSDSEPAQSKRLVPDKSADETPAGSDFNKARAFRDQSDTYFRRGQLTEAVAAQQSAVRFDPQNAALAYVLAYLQHRLGQIDAAQQTVQIANELDQKQPVSNWGQLMENYQGPSRIWLENARRD